MATQVRVGSWCLSSTRENSAASSGATLMVTSTLATVVSMMATMKAVYITLQHSPLAHSGQPPVAMRCHRPAPRIQPSAISSASALNALRQKVTSKLRADSRWRVSAPAMLHRKVTSSIVATADLWVMRRIPAKRACGRVPSGGACARGCSWA